MDAAVFCGIFFSAENEVYFQLDFFYKFDRFFCKSNLFFSLEGLHQLLSRLRTLLFQLSFQKLQSSTDCRVRKVQSFQAKRQDFARKIYLFIKAHQLRNKPIIIIKRLIAENCWQHMISNYDYLLNTLDRWKWKGLEKLVIWIDGEEQQDVV